MCERAKLILPYDVWIGYYKVLRDLAGSTPSFFQDAKKINVNAENTACGAPAVQIHNRNVSAVFRKSWAQEQGYVVLAGVDFDPGPPVSLIGSQRTWDLITFQSLGRFVLFEDCFFVF